MKILYVIDSLANKGGAERILSEKMNYLADVYGYDVYVITCYQNRQEYPNSYFLSNKVCQIDLNISYYSQYKYKYPRRLWVKWQIYSLLCRKIEATINEKDPDILIGVGYFMADVLCKLKCRAKKIIESHEARIFTMSDQGLSRSWFSRGYMKLYRKCYFSAVEKQSDVVVTLTSADAQEWRRARKVVVIPNFTMMSVDAGAYNSASKRVIAVGRLEWQKGFDLLIEAWKRVSESHPDWHLDIFGSGSLQEELEQQIRAGQMQQCIQIHPFTQNIVAEYMKSALFVLSSRFEGFGLVLLEAMTCGLPCISYDCPFGPGDIIDDGECGLLVQDRNVALLSDRISYLVEHEDIRKNFAIKAVEKAKVFSVDRVMLQWKDLFEQLLRS